MARLEAAIKVYAPLCRLEHLRADVLKKMVAMLLHPFPRVCSIPLLDVVVYTDRL
jgi:hypothetical protein